LPPHVRSSISFERPLVVPGLGERYQVLAVAEGLEAGLLPLDFLFDDYGAGRKRDLEVRGGNDAS
jgi:hypothetical protein